MQNLKGILAKTGCLAAILFVVSAGSAAACGGNSCSSSTVFNSGNSHSNSYSNSESKSNSYSYSKSISNTDVNVKNDVDVDVNNNDNRHYEEKDYCDVHSCNHEEKIKYEHKKEIVVVKEIKELPVTGSSLLGLAGILVAAILVALGIKKFHDRKLAK